MNSQAQGALENMSCWIAAGLFLNGDYNKNKKQTQCDIRQLKLALSSSTKSGNPCVLYSPDNISQLNKGSESQQLWRDFQGAGPWGETILLEGAWHILSSSSSSSSRTWEAQRPRATLLLTVVVLWHVCLQMCSTWGGMKILTLQSTGSQPSPAWDLGTKPLCGLASCPMWEQSLWGHGPQSPSGSPKVTRQSPHPHTHARCADSVGWWVDAEEHICILQVSESSSA